MPTAKTALPSCLNVGILWGHGSIASTAAAAVDALRAMNMLAAMRPGGAQPVVRWLWLQMPHERDATPPPVPGADPGSEPLDVVVIPGWLVPTGPQLREISRRYSEHFGAMLQGHLQRGGRVAALFNGSSLLAHCGLLAGRKAALPWVFAPSIVLQSSESGARTADVAEVAWQRERTWQRDGALWTAASLQDTLAVMLDLLAQTSAAELAQAASHALLFDPQRQLTATTAMETPTGHPLAAGALEQARRWLQDHRNEPYSLQATARAAATSPRTLLRWFAQVHGETPQNYLHRLRIAQAQALLQTTYLTVDDVAQQCGYNDTGSFRKVFTRVAGVTPGAYRQRFKLRTSRKQWLGRQGLPGTDGPV